MRSAFGWRKENCKKGNIRESRGKIAERERSATQAQAARKLNQLFGLVEKVERNKRNKGLNVEAAKPRIDASAALRVTFPIGGKGRRE